MLGLARVHSDALTVLARAGLIAALGDGHVYERVEDAVDALEVEVR